MQIYTLYLLKKSKLIVKLLHNYYLILVTNLFTMKKIVIFAVLAFTCSNLFAQQLVQTVLRNTKKQNVIGETFLGVQTTIPLSLNSVIGSNGKTVFPASYVYIDHGVYQNYTIGALLGYTASKSGVTGTSEYDLLSLTQQLLCNTDSATAASLGLNCDKNSTKANVTTSYALIGLRGQYHVQAGKKANMYGCLTVGYKAGKIKSDGVSTTSPVLSNIVNTYNTASKIFGSTVLGVHYYIDKKNNIAVTAEAGAGYGWGDNIVIGTRTLMLNLGLTYHISKAKKGVTFKR